MRTLTVVALLVSTALMVAIAQESQPTVSGVVLDRTLQGKGMPGVQVSAKPLGNPRTTDSDGSFILEFPQIHPGESIHINLEKRDDRNGEEYVVVNDVQLDTFLPKDLTHTLIFIICKQGEREEYARHFYKMGSLRAIKDVFERELAGVEVERGQLEQKLKATQQLAAGQEQELLRQLNEKDETISQLQRKRAQAEAQAESISESLAAGTAQEEPGRYRQAMALFLDGKIDEALKLLDDDDIAREADRANREIASGQRDLTRAIDEWLLKAALFTSKLQFDDAEKTYLRAIGKAPSSFKALYGYAQLELHLHHHDLAIDAFSRSAQLADGSNKANAAKALNGLGNTYLETGNFEAAATALERSLSTYEALAQTDPTTFDPLLARALGNLGTVERHLDTEHQGRAKEHFDRARNIVASLPQPESPSNLYLSAALNLSLGNLYYAHKIKINDAITEYESSVSSFNRLAESDARSYRPDQAQALNNLGLAELDVGEEAPTVGSRNAFHSQAGEHLQAAEKIRQELASEIPQVYERDYAETLTNLGLLYETEMKFDQAREKLEKAKAIRSRLADKGPVSYQNALANTLTSLGKLSHRQYGSVHDPDLLQQAVPDLKEAVRIRESLAKADPRQFTIPLGDSLNTIGAVYVEQKRWDDAQHAFEEALEYYEKLDAQTRAYPAFHELRNLGYLELRRGRTPEARKAFALAQDYFEFFSPEEKIVHKDEVLDVALTLSALEASESENPE
jgi:tetratricopeptide (TPR) repeat protein